MTQKITKAEIEVACDNLKQAMIAKLNIEIEAEKIQPARQKAHKTLLLAHDAIRALKGY